LQLIVMWDTKLKLTFSNLELYLSYTRRDQNNHHSYLIYIISTIIFGTNTSDWACCCCILSWYCYLLHLNPSQFIKAYCNLISIAIVLLYDSICTSRPSRQAVFTGTIWFFKCFRVIILIFTSLFPLLVLVLVPVWNPRALEFVGTKRNYFLPWDRIRMVSSCLDDSYWVQFESNLIAIQNTSLPIIAWFSFNMIRWYHGT